MLHNIIIDPKNAEVAYQGLYDQNKIQIDNLQCMFDKLENIYSSGVSTDGLHTISLGMQMPILLLWYLKTIQQSHQ